MSSDQPAKKVLIVDDEIELAEILDDILRDEGFATRICHSGRDGLKALNEESFDLVLSDVRMRDGSGIELVEEWREANPVSPPIALVSAYNDISLAETLYRGAARLERKPVVMDALIKMVNELTTLPQERWQQTPTTEGFNIKKTFKSLEDAIQSKKFQIGHAGFFIASEVPDKSIRNVKLSIAFTDDDKTFTGTGTVRWTRILPDQAHFLNGYGIEIDTIGPGSWILPGMIGSDSPTRAYIPLGLVSD